jgi:hypothetical protein
MQHLITPDVLSQVFSDCSIEILGRCAKFRFLTLLSAFFPQGVQLFPTLLSVYVDICSFQRQPDFNSGSQAAFAPAQIRCYHSR